MIITVQVVTGVDGGGGSTNDIIAVCRDLQAAQKIKQEMDGYVNISVRKAVVSHVFDDRGSGKEPKEVLLLDEYEEDRQFPLNVNLFTKQRDLKASALAKLSEEEIEALKELGFK